MCSYYTISWDHIVLSAQALKTADPVFPIMLLSSIVKPVLLPTECKLSSDTPLISLFQKILSTLTLTEGQVWYKYFKRIKTNIAEKQRSFENFYWHYYLSHLRNECLIHKSVPITSFMMQGSKRDLRNIWICCFGTLFLCLYLTKIWNYFKTPYFKLPAQPFGRANFESLYLIELSVEINSTWLSHLYCSTDVCYAKKNTLDVTASLNSRRVQFPSNKEVKGGKITAFDRLFWVKFWKVSIFFLTCHTVKGFIVNRTIFLSATKQV